MRGDGFAVGFDAHLRTVAADRRKLVRRKDEIDVVERTAADQRQRAVGALVQAVQGLGEARRHPDLAWRRCEIEQRAIDIQQHGGLAQMRHQRTRHRNGIGRFVIVG